MWGESEVRRGKDLEDLYLEKKRGGMKKEKKFKSHSNEIFLCM